MVPSYLCWNKIWWFQPRNFPLLSATRLESRLSLPQKPVLAHKWGGYRINNRKQPTNKKQTKHRNWLCLQIGIIKVTAETTTLKSQWFWLAKALGLADLMFCKENIFCVPKVCLWLLGVRSRRDWGQEVPSMSRGWEEGRMINGLSLLPLKRGAAIKWKDKDGGRKEYREKKWILCREAGGWPGRTACEPMLAAGVCLWGGA